MSVAGRGFDLADFPFEPAAGEEVTGFLIPLMIAFRARSSGARFFFVGAPSAKTRKSISFHRLQRRKPMNYVARGVDPPSRENQRGRAGCPSSRFGRGARARKVEGPRAGDLSREFQEDDGERKEDRTGTGLLFDGSLPSRTRRGGADRRPMRSLHRDV